MNILKKRHIFAIILIQSLLAVTAGFVAGCFFGYSTDSCRLYIGEVEITGLTPAEAGEKAAGYYGSIENKGLLSVLVYGKEFDILNNEIGLDVKWEQAMKEAYHKAAEKPSVREYMKARLGEHTIQVWPDFSIDRGLLTDRIKEIAKNSRKEPVDASVRLENNSVLKTAEVNGYELDVQAAVEKILQEFSIAKTQEIVFDNRSGVFNMISADITTEDFKGLDSVVSTYSTSLTGCTYMKGLEKLAECLDGLVIENRPEQGPPFSYWRETEGVSSGINLNEAHNQMASTIYGALLCAGIDVNEIKRVPCNTPREYIEAGLEACVTESDLLLEGMRMERIMLCSYVDGPNLSVKVVGPESEREYLLKSSVIQMIDPPVICVRDTQLEQGVEQIEESGLPGMKVSVYRTVMSDGREVETNLLYTDIYRPVSRIVKTGYPAGQEPVQK